MGKFTKEEKKKRVQLLMEQSILHENHCWECPRLQYFKEEKKDTGSQTPDKLCGGCQVYDRLREIGDALTNKGRKTEEEEESEKRNELTPELYVKLREEGKMQKEIREMFNIPQGSWHGIKKKLEGAIG